MRVVTVTLASAARLKHLVRQQERLRAPGGPDRRVIVWLDETGPEHPLGADRVVRVPPGPHGLRLAQGRNAGAGAAMELRADLIVFLDADCLAGPELFDAYATAAARCPDAVLCGPVTYLPSRATQTRGVDLAPLTAPHPARPAPEPGTSRRASAEEYSLFWSLSFALTPAAWEASGGFHPGYEGYGAEDTDFAFTLRERGTPMLWVGGAHAYHQYHPTTSPPWQHLDAILRNGRVFASRWGEWPMTGWLHAFEAAGAIRRVGEDWRRT